MTTSDTAQIRQTLNMAFDDSELSAFCLDYFPKIYDKFSQGMRKDDKITLLLDYCRRHPTGFDTLLDNVRKEYTYPAKSGKTSHFERQELKPLIDALCVYIDSSPQIVGTTTAQARLYAMPTDEVPAIKSLPTGSRIPFGRYAHFVGRETELRQLASILKREHSGAAIGQIVTTTGLGGIGKTQLAVEFAHRYGQYFAGGVFWLDFSTAAGISNEVARCGGKKGMNLLAGFDNLPLPDQVDLVQRAWHESLPRLLIFDNCDQEELVDEWRPTTGGCRVLITSRRGTWDPARAIQQVRLDILTPAESDALLAKLAHHLSSEEKAKIADKLGHFPLALHLAGSFLNRYKGVETVTDYLNELTEAPLRHPSLVGIGNPHSPTEHEQHVARTFAISWRRLDSNDKIDRLAQQLFLHTAHFAPSTPIPPNLLQLTIPSEENITKYDHADAQRRLIELGLLEQEPNGLTIHRLVAAFAHTEPTSDAARQEVEEALSKEAERLNEAGYPAALQAWQAHLRHLTDIAKEREDEVAADLCNEMGLYLYRISDYTEGHSYLERAYAIREKVLSSEHPLTAESLNNLGVLLQAMGEYEQACCYLECALSIWEKGAEHHLTALSLNNLGALWQEMGEYEQARSYLEHAYAIRKKVLGPEHPDTAQSLNNLGYLLQVMGEYKQARPYLEHALAIREKVLGAEHPDTAETLNNLGLLLNCQANYDQARAYHERAQAIWEKALGIEHPLTARSLNNLGVLLQEMGEYEQARPYYERTLTIWEKVLGAEHPLTAISLNNLGELFRTQGQYEQARPYYERALAIHEKMLGAEHPHTANSLNNLGNLLQELKEYEQARPYYERALIIKEKVLGAEHPDIPISLANLGLVLQAQGEYEQALLYFKRAQAINEKVLGAKHSNTTDSLSNLGTLWQAMGEYEKARSYLERTLSIREKVLGAEHPNTAISLGNLGKLWKAMGEYEKARSYLERALNILEKRLGKEHPYTQKTLKYLAELPSTANREGSE